MNNHIVLIGMAGSGKTTVGKTVATLVQRPFVEIDAAIEYRAQLTIPDIFARQGEKTFRTLEMAVLQDALVATEATVISTGGGAVLNEVNGKEMRRHGWVVYLQASLLLLQTRLAADNNMRPLLGKENLSTKLSQMLQQREACYQRLAHLAVVQEADDTPARVAEKIQAGLRHVMHG